MNKDQIRQILIDQKDEFQARQIHSKPRQARANLAELTAQSNLAKVVQGIRRCGKSTLCHQALEGYEVVYVNFDDERLVGLVAAELQQVLEVAIEINPKAQVYFFDEIQNVESWELFVNRLQRTKHNLVISGSNGKLLGKELATHLTGRQLSLMLYPLSFSEFLDWKGEGEEVAGVTSPLPQHTSTKTAQRSKYFSEYFESGGFPEVVDGEPQGPYLRELFDKIISRDLVQRYNVRDVKKLKEIASYLLQNSAQLISFGALKKTFGLKSIVTIQKYVSLLQDVFLIHEIKGYSYKLKERSTSPRKTYACDLGMIKALCTKPTPDLGAKFETLIFLHLLRTEEEIYYVRQDSREVDFCVVKNGKPYALVQACYDLSDQKTRQREIRALVEVGEKLQITNCSIVTRDEEEIIKIGRQTISVVPVVKYLKN